MGPSTAIFTTLPAMELWGVPPELQAARPNAAPTARAPAITGERRSTDLFLGQGDGAFGAVGHGQAHTVLQLRRHGPVTLHRARTEVVGVEHLGHERVAAAVALAAIRVDGDLHGKTTGRIRGPRTCPPAQATSAPSASRNSGMRFNHSSSATRSSMRARFEPAQRWMPDPKATCRFTARSITTWSAFSKTAGSRLAAGNAMRIRSPAFIGQPAYSTSLATTRAMVTGE